MPPPTTTTSNSSRSRAARAVARVSMPSGFWQARPTVPVTIVFAGPTAQHHPLRLEARGGRVVRVVVTGRRYACGVFGDPGPLRVVRRVSARVAADGSFRLTAGPPSERLTVRGVAGRRRATGSLRVLGTIATGEPCASGWVRFRLPRAAPRR